MYRVISDYDIPLKMWTEPNDHKTLEQARHVCNAPYSKKWVVLLPDCHPGYGMPIGTVMAAQRVIVPNAVGVDIGCGMVAVEADLTEISTETVQAWVDECRRSIPLGRNWHKDARFGLYMPDGHHLAATSIVKQQWGRAQHQLGTLGGGNHFIELQWSDTGKVWLMVHSGSRNLGKQVADHYNKEAKKLNKTWHSGLNPKWELAFLPWDSKIGQDYVFEMRYAMKFAEANRTCLVRQAFDILEELTGAQMTRRIESVHNFAALEHHYGQNFVIHRKGAILARSGTTVVIPGSMGSHSYIGVGLGEPESFQSCSHGAGRLMSRSKAKQELDLDTELIKLNGVVHGIKSASDLDEAVGSYKSIETVMASQSELVRIAVTLSPLGSVKG